MIRMSIVIISSNISNITILRMYYYYINISNRVRIGFRIKKGT